VPAKEFCMSQPARKRMTSEVFIAWAMAQPEGCRYELVAGEVVAMSPERVAHNEAKGNVYLALRRAIEERGLPCQAYTDGMAVRIDDDTVYEPDALVRCGERLGPDMVQVVDPLILVEVISPGTRKVDTTQKLGDYFRLPSVRHYLIVNTSRRSVVHHERAEDSGVRTRIAAGGRLELEPPGIVVDVAALFAV
jgi:Uma2 family endonuclease